MTDKQSQKAVELLRRAEKQLMAWATWYSMDTSGRVPPAGDVRLLEDMEEWNRRTEPSPAEAKVGMQLIRADVVEFLRGAGLLDGCAFGERPLGAEGEFWWRQYLPDEATAEVSSGGLPELPPMREWKYRTTGYTAEDMRNYARQALLMAGSKRAKNGED